LFLRVRFPAPPTKPGVQLSLHPAFHPSITLSLCSVTFAFRRYSWVRFPHVGFMLSGCHSSETEPGHLRRSCLRVPFVRGGRTETGEGLHSIHRAFPVHPSVTSASVISTNCPPSPCGRLSRPRTTTGAPPLVVVVGRMFALAYHDKVLTFPGSNSAG